MSSLPLLLQQHQWCRDGKTFIEMPSQGRVQFLTSVPAISRTTPCPLKRDGHVQLFSTFSALPPLCHWLGNQQVGEAAEGGGSVCLATLINWDGNCCSLSSGFGTARRFG